MKNREVYQRDPDKVSLLNNGVAAVTDVLSDEERRTLRFELEHFVCEGEYRRGLVRILDSYVSNQGQPEQPAAWVSGFFGSGKSHFAKMLRYLWVDYTFPEDGASARGLAHLPEDVTDLFKEISTLGRRGHGLHAAAGTLGAGAGDSVRLALLGIVFKSAELPESYPQARFCLWLRKNGLYDPVAAAVEAAGRDFRRELNDLYVSPVIARALLEADADFAASEGDARANLRAQFPRVDDVANDELVDILHEVLAADDGLPCTAVILDEVQQYIGDGTARSYQVQEVVEACCKRFGDRLLFVGTGQTALTGTPALQRLQGRFTVNVELSDSDVETVTRRVVLAKRPDRTNDVKKVLDENAGEVDRQLTGTRIAARSEDKAVLVDDYPLLPVRRRFWETVLRAVDRAGTAGQLRTQLRIVYDAIRQTANAPLGTVVPADFLYDEIGANLLQSGVLLREIHETIGARDDGTEDGRLAARLCALVFLIRKLPREAGADTGVRATADMLADLLVADLAADGPKLRARVPALLDGLVDAGVLIKLEEEYSLQTRESAEWEAEFRDREAKLRNDTARMASKRGQLLAAAVQGGIGALRLAHGSCKEPRKLSLHFGPDEPATEGHEIPVWIRDGWGADEKSVLADARAAGTDSPVVFVFVPRSQADALTKLLAVQDAARGTLDYKGTPTAREGIEARDAMHTRHSEATSRLDGLLKDVVNGAKVIQGGGNECLEQGLAEKVKAAAGASLDRLFPEFADADDDRWHKVIERARRGAEHPLEVIDFSGKTEEHPVCAAVLSHIGSGRKGRDVRAHFSGAPYGWPRDAVDAALIGLFAAGHLRVTANGVAVKPGQLDQGKIASADFRVESATVTTRERLTLRKLFQSASITCKQNEEGAAADAFLRRLLDFADGAGGNPPLPERPATGHVSELRSLGGNELLRGVLDRHDELRSNLTDWSHRAGLAEARIPAFGDLETLLHHAHGRDFAGPIETQVEAIVADRSLLEPTDPVPPLARTLVDGLREALASAEQRYCKAFDNELKALAATDAWQRLPEADREEILRDAHLEKLSKGRVGTAQDVLASLKRISLDSWETRTAALPARFTQARLRAEQRIEPKTQHVKLSSGTLRTPEDVNEWLTDTERQLLERLDDGPVVIG